jgi:glycolate oxidase iron-sulfur subunit
MLEDGRPAEPEVVKHIDRCLSCLSCMTTCPSGVHYMHLVDHARAYIEHTYRRPLLDRALRAILARVLPHPRLLRPALFLARPAKVFSSLLSRAGLTRLSALLRLAPSRIGPAPLSHRQVFPAEGRRLARVALLRGCVNDVLAPQVNAAAIRVLNRHGVEVVLAAGEGCCGGLTHHMGKEEIAMRQARNNIDAWTREVESGDVDAILVTASGCGTTIKDYGFMFRGDPAYGDRAAKVSSLARDVSEYLSKLDLAVSKDMSPLAVAYQAPCSLQHGQKVTRDPKELLARAGFSIKDIPEAHMCCGSAGTYNLLQPALARQLGQRKAENIGRVNPDIVASSNLGCMVQIGQATAIPIVHLVQLIDWATGGPPPEGLSERFAPAKPAREHEPAL